MDTHPLEVTIMEQQPLNELERGIERLLDHCRRLEEENRQLREREQSWRSERMHLVQQRDSVRTRVEAMISRLKAMEQGQ